MLHIGPLRWMGSHQFYLSTSWYDGMSRSKFTPSPSTESWRKVCTRQMNEIIISFPNQNPNRPAATFFISSPCVLEPLGGPCVTAGAALPPFASPVHHWRSWAAPAERRRAESRGPGASCQRCHWSETSAAHLDPASTSCSRTAVLAAALNHSQI